MHIPYWGLTHSPFASQLEPRNYYPSVLHEEALARLDFLIANGRRLGFLLGGPGTGKSMLLEVAARQLRRGGSRLVKFNVMGLSGAEFTWKLALGLGSSLLPSASPLEYWRVITDHLTANRYHRVSTVVLLDDVDESTADVHAAISRLALIDPHPEARLTVVLTAQRQRSGALGSKLNELCDLRIELEAFDEVETAAFVEYECHLAGATRSLFDVEAIERMYCFTHGNPRRICQIAELGLLAGAAESLEVVTAGVIESVQQSLAGRDVPEVA
jgi:type II secretory pathway predicted ATPase ExeA